jgi:hypothetical protein
MVSLGDVLVIDFLESYIVECDLSVKVCIWTEI